MTILEKINQEYLNGLGKFRKKNIRPNQLVEVDETEVLDYYDEDNDYVCSFYVTDSKEELEDKLKLVFLKEP